MMYGHTQVAPQAAGKPLYAAACLAYSDLTLKGKGNVFYMAT